MKYFQLIAFLFLSLFLHGQAELVMDINEGDGDSGIYCDFTFTRAQNCFVELGDKIIFQAENDSIGRELYVLENGVVDLLVDLNSDPSSSDPQYLTVFRDMAYFLANDNTGYKVWRTDGTASGTEIAFDLGVDDSNRPDYSTFLINENELYFEFEGVIYSFDGDVLSSFSYDSDIYISGSSNNNSRSWCSYKEGVAIMDYNGATWDLLYLHDGLVEVLTNFNADASSKAPYAMAAFDGGLSFSFDASFDATIEGRYVYLDGGSETIKQSDDWTRRNVSVNNESCVLYGDSEFILYDINNPMGVQLETGTLTLVAGADWNRIVFDNYLAFQSSGGTWEDDRVSLLNARNGVLKTVYLGDDLAKIFNYENYILFFAESPTSFFGKALYSYNIFTDELDLLHDLADTPLNPVLSPLGVQEDHLYFYAELDDIHGTEVYRIPVDLPVATQDLKDPSIISFNQVNGNTLQLNTNLQGDFEVEVLSISGQLIQKQMMSNKMQIQIPYNGLVCLRTNNGKTSETQMKYVFMR